MDTLMRFDTFRRLEEDLREGTFHGAMITIISWTVMIYLLWTELSNIYVGEYTTEVTIADMMDREVSINFNITMLDLPCRFAELNLWDIFEEYRINVTSGITQRRNMYWENGKLEYGSKPLHEDKEVKWDDPVELDLEGHHAIDLRAEFDKSIEEVWTKRIAEHTVVIANFYASWCIWSMRLKPIYEEAAVKIGEMSWLREYTQVSMVGVDCAVWSDFCDKKKVMAFPSIFYYFKGEQQMIYDGDRTVDAIVQWTVSSVRKFDQDHQNTFKEEACQLVGQVYVPRVPGNMFIQAGSDDFTISPSMTNASHYISHLSFGKDIDARKFGLPLEAAASYSPLDGKNFIVKDLHQAPHHYINVVPNIYSNRGLFYGQSSKSVGYQLSVSNKVKGYRESGIPEAQFTYRFSNIMLHHVYRGQGMYHVLTNFCAIIGGTYAVMHLANLLVNRILVAEGRGSRLLK